MKPICSLLFSCLVVAATHAGLAQVVKEAPASKSLYQTIAGLDASLFDAYNGCDLKTLGTLVTDDLEFYHDRTGLAVGRPAFIESIGKYICGKVTRELVPGTLEVYPIGENGAIEIGTHRFHHPGKDSSEPLGEARFVMIWANKQGVWRLSRVISYDHGTVTR